MHTISVVSSLTALGVSLAVAAYVAQERIRGGELRLSGKSPLLLFALVIWLIACQAIAEFTHVPWAHTAASIGTILLLPAFLWSARRR